MSESLINVHIDIVHVFLVSTHVVCERLSAMQGFPEFGMGKIFAHFAKNTNSSFDYSRVPSPLKIEIWPGLGTLSFDYSRKPPTP